VEVFVGITGASGSPYARRVVQALIADGHTVGVSFSGSGLTVTGQELYGDLQMPKDEVLSRFLADTDLDQESVYDERDYGAPYASGSARWDAAVIVPCSMATLSAIASGAEANLLHRAANVALKEGRKLIMVPRETPLSIIQLENMLRVARAGAHIAPAMPGFYNRPASMEELVDFVAGKILNLLGVDQSILREWRGHTIL
jgi:4-hydroxy-3-polyprenylbenzoate decarboxylase